MSRYRFDKILSFLETIDQFKVIYRAAYLCDHSRNESDAEHTWHVCLFALLLHQEMSFNVDIAHVLKLILVHDLVEIYAGDTFAHDVAGYLDKSVREQAAAEKLFALLPEDLQILVHGWWEEFEAQETPEAKFATAMDRLQGFAQNLFGGGRVWQERQVTEAMSLKRNQQAIAIDPGLAEVFQILYQRATDEQLWTPTSITNSK